MTTMEQPQPQPVGARSGLDVHGYALCVGQVFDGHALRGPSVVVVDQGRIASVRPAGEPTDPGLQVVDLEPGVTLLPGLIDPHVHLVFDASAQVVENVQQVSDEELTEQMRVRARTALTAGVTTMRDLGDRRFLTLPLRDELASRPDAGPQLLCAGPPITTPRGHCWFLGGEAASDAELREAVADRARRGVDAVKVMATGGEMTPGSNGTLVQFDQAALGVIVAEARRYGLPVAAHAHAAAGIANALAAGVDCIEHCSFMTDAGVEADDDLIAAIAASGVIVSLTVGITPTDVPPPPRILAMLPKFLANIRKLVAAGTVMTLGSDAGIGPPKPHDVLPYTLVALADLTGDSRLALTAATSVAARAVGLASRKGAIAAGYDADFVAVHGDPVADIRAVHDVAAVYRSGVRVAGARSVPAAPRTG